MNQEYQENESGDQRNEDTKRTSFKIPRIEEQVKVEVEDVETGRVHVKKLVKEHLETVNIPINSVEVKVERKQKNQYVSTPPPAIRTEGDTTIISILKEEIVIEKRLLLVEEVHITQHHVSENIAKDINLRAEEIHINRTKS